MANYVSPIQGQFFDDNGDVLNGGLLYTYEEGTTTNQATYTTRTGTTAHANPIVLDADGRPPNPIFLIAGANYKLVLKNSSGTTLQTWDGIFGIGDLPTTVTQWISGGTPTFVTTTTFTQAGDTTGTMHVGRRLKLTDSSTLYGVILVTSYDSPTNKTTVTVLLDSGSLSSSLSAVEYGLLSNTNRSIPVESQSLGTGFITGFVPAHDTDTDHDMTITAGECRDAADTVNIESTITYAKQIDAAFAAGDDAGGMFTGAVAPSTTYHACLIQKDSTGAYDWGFDTSVSGANTPTGYTFRRRLFSIITDSSSNIVNETWREMAGGGLEAMLLAPTFEFSHTASNFNTAQTGTLARIPGDVQMTAILSARFADSSPTVQSCVLFSALDQADTAPNATVGGWNSTLWLPGNNTTDSASGEARVRTSTSRTFRYRGASTSADHQLSVASVGFIDERR